jgi:hypothetical protein
MIIAEPAPKAVVAVVATQLVTPKAPSKTILLLPVCITKLEDDAKEGVELNIAW